MNRLHTQIGKKKQKACASAYQKATKRLLKELQQIEKEPIPGVAALPLENNLFLWHFNVLGPEDTPWKGAILHGTIHFDKLYPAQPPSVILATKIDHPNVDKYNLRVCLDMLEVTEEDSKNDDEPYRGWTPAYTIQSILVQLQAFLFEANLSSILKNISDPTRYETKKQEWHSAVRWSVEQSRAYSDKSVGHFAPRKLWPPVQEVVTPVHKSKEEQLEEELVCFYTRQTYKEDSLGYGISFNKSIRTGDISNAKACTSDYISLRAFMNHHVRTSSTQESFTHFLPIYLNDAHGQKSMHLAKRALSIICTGSHGSFQPEQALNLLPKLMNSTIVQMLTGQKAYSSKALNAYCNFHHLLLKFIEEFPELQKQIDDQVDRFVHQGKYRLKEYLPNLGDFLALLSVSSFDWELIEDAFLNESFTRSSFWILNKYPELAEFDHVEFDDTDRLEYSFKVTNVSQKILLFQLYFLQKIAKPEGASREQILTSYNERCGIPSLDLEVKFLDRMNEIQSLSSYQEFFTALGKDKSEKDIAKLLKDSIISSEAKGYHGAQSENVLSPEQYSKQSRTFDMDKFATRVSTDEDSMTLYELVDDEPQWKSMASTRWGFTELPDYLTNASAPWRKLYLQHNLQDVISSLNDNPDFKYFHKTCEVSREIPRIEILMFQPSNIKSRYFFLTILLSKLTSLKTLIIRKGSEGLSKKGFKALARGMAYSSSNLENLILQHCNISPDAIKELTHGDNRLRSNLKTLNLSSNPLGDNGAISLAHFLRRHDNLPELEELNLSNCRIGKPGAQAISEALLSKRSLRRLILMNNPTQNGLEQVLRSLAFSSEIEEVKASNSGYVESRDSTFDLLLDLSLSLKKLNLWKVNLSRLSGPAMRMLGANDSLTEMDLAGSNFKIYSELGQSLASNTQLKVLHLDMNSMNSNDLSSLWTGFENEFQKEKSVALTKNPQRIIHLEKLTLSQNNFTSYENSPILESIGNFFKACKKLKVLNLENCSFNGPITESFAEALLPKENVPLEVLNLRGNSLISYFKPIAAALQENRTVRNLDISGNKFGVKGATRVAEMLSENASIEELCMFGNFSEIEGCLCISESLKKNKTLKILDLGLNRIRERGCRALIASLQENSSLESLALKHNHLSDSVSFALAKQIAESSNSKINYLALAGNFISPRIRAEIALVLSKASRKISFDMQSLVQFKEQELCERTVYITPLPKMDEVLLALEIKKTLYSKKVGAIKNVHIHKHKTQTQPRTSQYAFVEFAHPDSIQLCLNVQHGKSPVTIAGQEVRIQRSGAQARVVRSSPKAKSTGISEWA